MKGNGSRPEVELGGRVYRMANLEKVTFDQYQWLSTAVQKAGLPDIPAKIQRLIKAPKDPDGEVPLEAATEVSKEIILRVFESGQATRLLAGNLVESGRPWTRRQAEKTEERLGALTGMDDINRMQDLLVGVILAFFTSGLGSERTSGNSSPGPGPEAGASEATESDALAPTSETSTP